MPSVYSFMLRFKRALKPFILKMFSKRRRFDLKKIKRIGWIPSGLYGDMAQMSMIPRELKKIYPTALIILFADEGRSDIFALNPFIDEITPLPEGVGYTLSKHSFTGFFRLYRLVRGCDIIIDMPDGLPWFALILYRLAGVKRVFQNDSSGMSNNFVTFIETDFSAPRRRLFRDLLVAAGNTAPDMTGELYVDAASEKYIGNFLRKNKINGRILLFNPESSTELKTLSFENTRSVVRKLLKLAPDFKIILINYKLEYNIKNCYTLKVSRISQTICAVKRADYVISVDTSSVHFADVFRKPMTELYSRWYSRGHSAVSPSHGGSWQNETDILCGETVDDIDTDDIVGSVLKGIRRTERV